MSKVLLFAGTTEGRILSHLKVDAGNPSVQLFVSIATDYGRELLPPDGEGFSLRRGRMDEEEIIDFIESHGIEKIIDATHPYATEVSENIRKAGKETGTPVFRLTRDEEALPSECIVVTSCEEAADYLKETEGPVLLTTGSKELSVFTGVPNFSERLFPRMLPDPDMMKTILDMGYRKQNLICMQGPFAEETNIGILRQIGAKYLVTKESGKAGGFPEKIGAAKHLGVKVILVTRPSEEKTISFEEAMKICGIPMPESASSIGIITGNPPTDEANETRNSTDSHFPLYVDVKGMPVLVVGGGKIAMRRAGVLRNFQCRITVVAKEVKSETDLKGMKVFERPFEETDLDGAKMVIAATDDEVLNARIGALCKERKIPVNVVSDKTLCDFYFPGIVRKENVTVGIIAGGRDHKKAAKVRERIERLLHEEESDCR